MFISLGNGLSLYSSNRNPLTRTKNEYLRGFRVAIVTQTVLSITIVALILGYIDFITEGQRKHYIAWTIGYLGAVYPALQNLRLASTERATDFMHIWKNRRCMELRRLYLYSLSL
jgi:hypothetical protein